MTQERRKPEMLRGYKFFHHPDMPTVGVLRLDTDNQHQFVMVTKQTLQALGEAALRHAEELPTAQ